MTEYKPCSRCKQTKPLELFNKDRSSSNGLQDRCRECEKVVRRIYYLQNKDKEVARVSNWHKNTKTGKARRKRAALNRKAFIRNAECNFISQREFDKLARTPCFYCGSKQYLTIDHIVPLSRGGRHSIGNLVSACNMCNATKNARFITEWVKENPQLPTQS